MTKTDVVRMMQTYIETHLDEKIMLGDLANVTHYSPWYCYRMFYETLQITISQYVRKLKLSKSALQLRDSSIKIIDVAYQYGFDSVDGYQRAFFKEFGVNPYEYSKHPIPIYLFTPYKIYSEIGERKMSEVKTVFVSQIVKPERKVLIKRGIKADNYWDYSNEVGCDVWGLLTSMPSLSGEPVCMWLPKQYIKPSTSLYVQGVEVPTDYQGEIPEGFDVILLPEATYLMFTSEPFEEVDYENAILNVWDAMGKYNPNVLGYVWDEDNPRIQLEPIGHRGYIELKAVKKK